MKYLSILFCLFLTCTLAGQERSNSLTSSKYELGVNITRILASALVNQSNPDQVDFPLTLKINGNKRTFRMGFDVELNRGDNFSLDTRAHDIAARFGIEKRRSLGRKWLMLYGIDAHLRAGREKTLNSNGFEITTLVDTKNGLGVSPLLGFQFLVSEHIAFEIETSIQFLAFRETSDLTFSQSSPLNVYESGFTYNLKLIEPRFIYLIVKF